MQNWFVVQVLSSHEKKVKKLIEEQQESAGVADLIEEVLIPTENVSELKLGEQKIVEKRLWPGYILIKMVFNDDTWAFIKDIQGVIGFLGGERPSPLTNDEVNEILKELREKKEIVVQKHHFDVGDIVKIVDGVFVNFTGQVTDVQHEKGRLSVLVSIFGRDTQVDDLLFTQVEKSSDELEQV